ncbi:hypothetical protein [Streptomyces pactum]|nr:hypothetical protein [Streptomyces pactum]
MKPGMIRALGTVALGAALFGAGAGPATAASVDGEPLDTPTVIQLMQDAVDAWALDTDPAWAGIAGTSQGGNYVSRTDGRTDGRTQGGIPAAGRTDGRTPGSAPAAGVPHILPAPGSANPR